MEALAGRDRRSQTTLQMLTAPGERRIVGNGEVETHYPEQRVQEPFGLAQREMVDEPQGQSGLDGEIRVAPLPTPPAAPAGRPGSDRFRGHPHRHIAAANEGPVVGRPVRHAIFRLVRGMDLRLHPCSVAPAEGHEKCRPNRLTPAGSSCNNAAHDGGDGGVALLGPVDVGAVPRPGRNRPGLLGGGSRLAAPAVFKPPGEMCAPRVASNIRSTAARSMARPSVGGSWSSYSVAHMVRARAVGAQAAPQGLADTMAPSWLVLNAVRRVGRHQHWPSAVKHPLNIYW